MNPVEVHLACQAGFANRLRAMVSGICLAQDLSANLVIFWQSRDAACANSLERLIRPQSWPNGMACDTNPLVNAQSCLSSTDLSGILEQWDRSSPLKIQSYGKFYTKDDVRWLRTLRLLRPVEYVEQRVNAIFQDKNLSECLGVHIRRGDNIKSTNASPLSLFIDRLNQEIGKTFIVATDDTGVMDTLNRLFPGRCIFPADDRNRHTPHGMVNGLIDFFALAKCPRIIGSAHSSFSEMAVAYGGGILEIIQL